MRFLRGRRYTSRPPRAYGAEETSGILSPDVSAEGTDILLALSAQRSAYDWRYLGTDRRVPGSRLDWGSGPPDCRSLLPEPLRLEWPALPPPPPPPSSSTSSSSSSSYPEGVCPLLLVLHEAFGRIQRVVVDNAVSTCNQLESPLLFSSSLMLSLLSWTSRNCKSRQASANS